MSIIKQLLINCVCEPGQPQPSLGLLVTDTLTNSLTLMYRFTIAQLIYIYCGICVGTLNMPTLKLLKLVFFNLLHIL